MKLKKITIPMILILIIAFSSLAQAAPSSTVITQLQNQVKSLQAQIKTLQTEVAKYKALANIPIEEGKLITDGTKIDNTKFITINGKQYISVEDAIPSLTNRNNFKFEYDNSKKEFYIGNKPTENVSVQSYSIKTIPDYKMIDYAVVYQENEKNYFVGYSSPQTWLYDKNNNYYLGFNNKDKLDVLLNIALGEKVFYNVDKNNPYIDGVLCNYDNNYKMFDATKDVYTGVNSGSIEIKYFNEDKTYTQIIDKPNRYTEFIPVNLVFEKLGIDYEIKRDDKNKVVYISFKNSNLQSKLAENRL